MKKAIVAVLSLCALAGAVAQGSFEAITSTASGGGTFQGVAGWTFQTRYPVTLTSLGCLETIIADNGGTPIRIGLWSDGVLLSDAFVSADSPLLLNGTRYVGVSQIDLLPGAKYQLGAYHSSGSIALNFALPGEYTVADAILASSVRRAANTAGWFPPIEEPNGLTIPIGPNFIYYVPEPSVLGLLELGALGLLWRGRRV